MLLIRLLVVVFLKLLSFVRLFFVGEFSMMLKASSASMVALPNWRWLVRVHHQFL
jgi:hypothetical protein